MAAPAVLETIHLNNMGVFHFEYGRNDIAIRFFIEALKLSKRALPSMDLSEGSRPPKMQRDENLETTSPFLSVDVEDGPSERNRTDEPSSSSPDREGRSCYRQIAIQREKKGHLPLSGAFIYQHTIRFPEGGLGEGQRPTLYSFICMFNLAIAYHVRANYSPDEDYNFAVVLRLYELTFALQAMEDLDVGITVNLAILNNLGQIHKRLNNKRSASRCFENMLASIVCLIEAAVIEDCEEIVRCFFSAALSELILSQPLTAPSA